MLLHRYANIQYIMDKDIVSGIEFINQAIKQNGIDRLREEWIVQLPFMNKETFVSFDDFKSKFMNDVVSTKSDEELLNDARRIEEKLTKGGE